MAVQKYITGSRAVEIEASIEKAIREGRARPGDGLPTVRECADRLGVSPATVASAYRALRERGLVLTSGRRGTRVSAWSQASRVRPPPVPKGVRDLSAGNPDPSLLPDWTPSLARIQVEKRLYGDALALPELLDLERELFAADGIPHDHLTIVSGALDGVERALAAHLRRGDRVAVEDPAFTGIRALVHTLGLVPVPVAIDERGLLPEALQACLPVHALIATPRAQNPTGAVLDPGRIRAVRAVLRKAPDVLVLEDDHAAEVSGAPAATLVAGRARWAVVRSHSKALGPDIRVATLSGDAETVARIEGRQLLGMRWVSHVLQKLVVAVRRDEKTPALLARASKIYTQRRRSLVEALGTRGIRATGASGLNVWIPVPEEAAVVSGLLQRGWAVAPGERFRLESAPAIRVTTTTLEPEDAERLAHDLAEALTPAARTLA